MREPLLYDYPTTRRVSCVAGVDPRTVDRVLMGLPTRPTVRVRVLEALLECGLVASEASPNEPSTKPPEEPETP
jgi:hypothetical protein